MVGADLILINYWLGILCHGYPRYGFHESVVGIAVGSSFAVGVDCNDVVCRRSQTTVWNRCPFRIVGKGHLDWREKL